MLVEKNGKSLTLLSYHELPDNLKVFSFGGGLYSYDYAYFIIYNDQYFKGFKFLHERDAAAEEYLSPGVSSIFGKMKEKAALPPPSPPPLPFKPLNKSRLAEERKKANEAVLRSNRLKKNPKT